MQGGTSRAVSTPVDLTPYYNWTGDGLPSIVGNPVQSDADWWSHVGRRVKGLPTGEVESWGVPYRMAGDADSTRVMFLTNESPGVTVPLTGTATHICVAHSFEQIPSTMSAPNPPREGMVVAEYVIEYADGARHTHPIRARFEVNLAESPGSPWLAQEFRSWEAVDPMVPRSDSAFGEVQFGLRGALQFGVYMVWNYALPNPHPDKPLKSITFQARNESPLIVAALTLFTGISHPLRHVPRHAYRIERPDGKPAIVESVDIDFGLVARVERTQTPRDEAWLASDFVGVYETWGGTGKEPSREEEDLLHLVGAEDATVSVRLQDDPEPREFNLGEAFRGGESRSGDHTMRVLGREHQWMTVRVLDDANNQPTPVRIHFSDQHGRYIAPHGHHEQVNTNWFEDYGADVRVGGRNYAYVNGEFAVDLPVGDVFVEIVKGFEYEPIRRKITVRPDEKTLDLNISRWTDLRSKGWVTADTHVHFVSPHTAWLEGAAEGVNVINLLASQWGRLFTNVGDVTGRVGVVHDDTIVYVGTENRNHMLGHMSMLGTKGNLPVYPMCAGGPTEAWVGDPDFRSMAEWALENKRKGGVVIRPHFPFCGYTEDPVSILAGLVDALEIGGLRGVDFPTQEWYRYLNCGYRVAVCGGTDKMSAGFAIGWLRTYAKLDPNEEFTYDRWADAVRAGRTFATTGPLMDLTVDGREIGSDIVMSRSGGTVEVHASAQSHIPLGSLEIVVNGEVVAKDETTRGARNLEMVERIAIDRSGWIAARCQGVNGHAGAHLAAHTSPVYVTCGDDRPFDSDAAEHMLSLVNGAEEYLNTLATNYDEDSRRRMVKLYNEAQEELKGRLIEETRHRR